jgi:hypothetical protein
LTDRLGVKVYASTTHNAPITISVISGDGRAAYFNSPLALRHSELRDKNSEADFQHLTAAEKLRVTNAVQIKHRYGIQLNGVNQYMFRDNPTNLEINSTDLITNADNSTFEGGVGQWVGIGNHTISQSNEDKRSGTSSLKVVASGVGSQAANYISLPIGNFGTFVAGKKYTIQLWGRAVGTTTINIGLGASGQNRGNSGNLSTVAGAFTAVCLNVEILDANDIQDLRVWLNSATTVYFDDVRVVEMYDYSMIVSFRNDFSNKLLTTANVYTLISSALDNTIFNLQLRGGFLNGIQSPFQPTGANSDYNLSSSDNINLLGRGDVNVVMSRTFFNRRMNAVAYINGLRQNSNDGFAFGP